jgi:multidrug resistance efflux pump
MQSEEAATGAAVIPLPNQAEARLRVALRQLDAALAEQREAVASFRREMAALGGAVAGLQDSASLLGHRLAEAASESRRAEDAAARLLVTAEAMERLA